MRLTGPVYLLITCVLLGLGAAPAYSSILTFTSESDWTDVTSGLTTIGFENLDPQGFPLVNGYYQTYSSGGITLADVQFLGFMTGAPNYTAVVHPPNADFSGLPDWGSGNVLFSAGAQYGGHILITLPSGGATAVGMDLMTSGPTAQQFTIKVSTDGSTYETFTASTFNNPTHAFFGVTSTDPIKWIDLIPQDGRPLVDNFSYGTADDPAQTSEPTTVLLFGSGLMCVLGSRYIKKRRLAAETA